VVLLVVVVLVGVVVVVVGAVVVVVVVPQAATAGGAASIGSNPVRESPTTVAVKARLARRRVTGGEEPYRYAFRRSQTRPGSGADPVEPPY
jgi:hypothetical protein